MQIFDTQKVLNLPWLKVFERKFRHNDQEGVWTFVSRSDKPPLHDQHKPNAVLIVACADDDKWVITSEFRVPIGAREISFPAGLIDKGEDFKQAAVREFKEETGMDFVFKFASPPNLYSSAGLSDESVIIVFGLAHGEPSTSGNEGSEDIQVMRLGRDEIKAMMNDPQIAISAKAWCIMLAITQGMDRFSDA